MSPTPVESNERRASVERVVVADCERAGIGANAINALDVQSTEIRTNRDDGRMEGGDDKTIELDAQIFSLAAASVVEAKCAPAALTLEQCVTQNGCGADDPYRADNSALEVSGAEGDRVLATLTSMVRAWPLHCSATLNRPCQAAAYDNPTSVG